MRRRMFPGSLEEQHPEEIRRELQGRPSHEGATSSNFAKPRETGTLSSQQTCWRLFLEIAFLLLEVTAHAA